MTKIVERLQIAPRPAAKIEYRVGWLSLDILQKRRDVLADVVLARGFPEVVGTFVIMLQRSACDALQVVRIQFHLAMRRKRFFVPFGGTSCQGATTKTSKEPASRGAPPPPGGGAAAGSALDAIR